jgi:hypothetical protein
MDPYAAIPEGLLDPAGRPAGTRFDVYRNNVAASLSNALAEGFPALNSLLGEGNFRILAGRLLRAHPPKNPVMALYGDEMPSFLEEFEPARALPYLADVARLELAMRHSYHAANARPADLSPLGILPPEAITATRLGLAPSLRLLRSRWPVLQVYRFALHGGEKPVMTPEDVLITRPGYDPHPQILPPGAATAIAALSGGVTLGDAADAATTQAPDFNLSITLGLLIADQAIIALHPPARPEP